MRAVELAKVAANAEALRLRQLASRQAMRAAYGAVAAVFGLAVLVLVHVVLYNILVLYVSPLVASLILLALDLVVAGICGLKALKSTPSAIEEEALAIRKQALIDLKGSVTMMSLVGEAAGTMFRRGRTVTVVKPRGTVRIAGELAARLLSRR
jgi:uncharacterized membrane protein